MNLWVRAIGRVALYLLGVGAFIALVLAATAALNWVGERYPRQLWYSVWGLLAFFVLAGWVASEHDRLAKEDDQ